MKLIREYISHNDLTVLTEDIDLGGGKKGKSYFLTGVFLEADVQNRNKRVYPKNLLMREVENFTNTKIKNNRAMGELDHPPEPTVNLQHVSHIITDLRMEGNQGIGKAKVLNTPSGQIIKALLEDGVVIGMSTRGVGSINGSVVGEDFNLITVDAVADPSAQNAFVEGVLENKQYFKDDNGIIREAIDELKKTVDKRYDHFGSSEIALDALMTFMKKIRQNSR